LETKKQKFARFYFVSDETLLSILSTGSNPEAIKEYLQNIFDALTGINFDDGFAISFYSVMGKFKEVLKMTEPLGAKEQIETWLQDLEKIMKKTVKKAASAAAFDVSISGGNKMETSELDN